LIYTYESAVLRLKKEIAGLEEIIDSESSVRSGPPSTFASCEFANEINIDVKETHGADAHQLSWFVCSPSVAIAAN
jgi:leucyl-tRNA synthetase